MQRSVTKKAPHPIDVHVGTRVRTRRMMRGMSRQRLADVLNLSCQLIQKYERGTNRIGASRLQHISGALQVSVSFFFEDAPASDVLPASVDNAPSPGLLQDFLASTDGLNLARAFTAIADAKLRRRIVELAEAIAAMLARERQRLADYQEGRTT